MVIDRKGNIYKNTRKKFLYKDDKVKLLEEKKFQNININPFLIKHN